MTNEQRIALLTASGLTAEEAAQTLATMGLTTAQAGATAATFSFAGAISALTAAFAANPIGFLLVGLTTAITIIKTVVGHIKQAREELNQTISDLTSQIQNLQKSSANVKELAARYEELANKTELSAEEQAEFVSIQNELKELLPEVNGYYDEQGNFVLAQGESLDSLTQTYREYLSLKRQELADAYAQKVKEQTREYVNQQAEIEKLNDLLTLQQLLKNGEGFDSFTTDRSAYESYKASYGDDAASVYYYDLASMYGGDMIENQKQLNELQSENKVILGELRDGTVNLISAQDEWYSLAENQQNGIRNIVSQMEFDEAKALYDEVSADGADYDAILQQILIDHADMIPVMNDTATAAESVSTELTDAKSQVSDMSETINKLSSSYELLATAMQEMANGRGLSPNTIKDLADAESNYLDYLYDENGVIKLNTAAWEARSRALTNDDIAAMEAEITVLESESKAIQDVIDNYAEKRRAALASQDLVSYQYYCEIIDTEATKLKKANVALAEKESLLHMVKTAYDSIQPADWDNTFSTFDIAVNQLETLANLQANSAAMADQAIHSIISEMYSNSMAHHSADAAGKKRLSDRNLELGASLSQYGISAMRGNDGVWYLDKIGGTKLYDKYRKYTYHDGGIAGEDPQLKPNEIPALLEKGERVITKAQNSRLLSLVKSGTDLIGGMIGRLSSVSPVVSEVEKSITNNDNSDSSVKEGDIVQENHFHLQNITEENMKGFAEYYSTYTINKLIEGNKRKGIRNNVDHYMLRG